ncbi:MAG: hypothetical protein EOO01_06100 [Chitinophagaceae bacterium]|nr:MAG: hypothetical protein EOO01_06100 [Chitinophagaceae bacterium]
MLFFGEPTQLLNWLQRPTGLLFMRDTMESYGYSHRLMQALSKAKTIPERLNVGVAGLASSKICWDQLEFWTKEMLNQEGSSYLQEQALTAMIASQTDHCFLSEQAYKVLPAINGAEVAEILHHYVAESKYDYFVKGWRLIKTGI